MNISPSVKLEAAVASPLDQVRRTIAVQQGSDRHPGTWLNDLTVQENDQHSSTAATGIITDATLMVELKGVVDFAQEAQRLEKEIGKLAKELTAIEKKLANPGFLSKAPEQVVADVREKQGLLSEKRNKLTATLDKVNTFI